METYDRAGYGYPGPRADEGPSRPRGVDDGYPYRRPRDRPREDDSGYRERRERPGRRDARSGYDGRGYDGPGYGEYGGYEEPDPVAGPPPGPQPPPGHPGDGIPPASGPAAEPKKNRAGRNLPAAIGVGLGLGAVVLASLFVWRPAFLAVVVVGVVVGTWEMVRAVGSAAEPDRQARPPLVPLLVGAAAMELLAWFGGAEALIIGLFCTVVAVLIWRLADGPTGYRRDVTISALIATYVPFLAGFAVLLVHPDDGNWRIVVTLATVVCSDTGGYVAGVFFGRHPMAPTVSPKKSWEGFAGSVLTCGIAGFLMLFFGFGRPWWTGAVFGVVLALVSVLGDLGESLLKRDLGIKDMGNILPGHGGVMDRLDSILLAVPTAYALLTVLAPPAG